tara:strand:+ start:277 stop:477 length:201 start_codon:yes stop_codon:yes gene_type:complete
MSHSGKIHSYDAGKGSGDTGTGAQSANQFDLIKRYAARIRALPENGGPRDVWNPAEQRDTAHGETP